MSSDDVTRRGLLRAAGGAAAAGGAVAGAGSAAAQEEQPDWPSGVEGGNLGSYEDARGEDEVTVLVGAGDNGLAFDPTKLWIDPGTTVVWEWTGDGGGHDVVAGDGSFESDLESDAGATFEHDFEEAGTYRYACTPHKSMGMKGAVVVE